MLAVMGAAVSAPAGAQPYMGAVQAELREENGLTRKIRDFYRARQHRPLWVRDDTLGPEAERLLELLETASLDGLDERRYRIRNLLSVVRKARRGSPEALAKAEAMLSQVFVAYVQDVRRPRQTDMVFVDAELAPGVPLAATVLQSAAAAPSLMTYLDTAGWMHPLYGQLRKGLALVPPGGAQERLLRLNLDRARLLPADASRRHIVVDAAGARLLMYENGQVRDSMNVIVGKQSDPTPMMAGLIRYAALNPYWNVPPDLVQERIAPEVLSKGVAYLKQQRYEVLSDWSDKATVTDPKLVNWKAVADGRQEIRVRQRPGPGNGMGKMKFMFPNDLGIYLHDTPDRALFRGTDRSFSAGCVRLEDAPRLAKWLYGKPLVTKSKTPEFKVDLPKPVPVYITYLTAFPEGQTIAFRQDRYGRDRAVTDPRTGRALAAR